MSSPAIWHRRRGHRETQFAIGLMALLCVPSMGLMTVARESARARKAHAVLETNEKWLAFAHGCASAIGLILASAIFIAIGVGIVIWLDNRRD